jgi:hypothetical protein
MLSIIPMHYRITMHNHQVLIIILIFIPIPVCTTLKVSLATTTLLHLQILGRSPTITALHCPWFESRQKMMFFVGGT